MSYPQFIALDSSNGDNAFPIAISWSLADGQLKSTLIIPSDEWEPWDNNLSAYDTAYLIDHGATCPEILQELVADLDSHELFSSDLEHDLALLEQICQSCTQERDMELLPFQLAFEQHSSEVLWREYDARSEHHGSDLSDCEGRVRTLVFLADALLER